MEFKSLCAGLGTLKASNVIAGGNAPRIGGEDFPDPERVAPLKRNMTLSGSRSFFGHGSGGVGPAITFDPCGIARLSIHTQERGRLN